MKKLFALMIMLFFTSPIDVISTEKEVSLSSSDKFQLSQTVATTSTYFNTIPTNPNVYYDETTFSDAQLTLPKGTLSPNQEFQITNLTLNDNQIPIFQLSNGLYIEASRQKIYDDSEILEQAISSDFWLNKSFTVYSKPYVKGVSSVKSDFKPFNKVHASKVAQTQQGLYYFVDNKGWISEKELSKFDNRMIAVQEMLSQKYNKSNFSIYVKQIDSQASAGINADKVMYGASIAKLATLYAVQDQVNSGAVKLDKTVKYVNEVNHFEGDYEPSGSGTLDKKADDKDYSIETLLKDVSKHSDNVATNILGYYVANKYDQQFYSKINAISGINWNMEQRQLSSRAAANVMESIYYQNGQIIGYLSDTDFDDKRISKNISVPVAHKIGDAYDYRHDVAIVYANSPFILSIFTENASYDDITEIADDVYSILK